MKSYCYVYFKIFHFVEHVSAKMGGSFLSGFKAGGILVVMEVWTCLSFLFYYTFISGNVIKLELHNPIILLPLMTIIGGNSWLFLYSKKYEMYQYEFLHWSRQKHRIGSVLVVSGIALAVLNIIFSIVLLSSVG